MKVDVNSRLGSPGDPNYDRALLDMLRKMADAINEADTPTGTTTNRPRGADLRTGRRYFDTTIGKPIWFNGTIWVDSTGTAA